MDNLWAGFATMFGIGFLGAGHCVGMCGGIISALGFAANTQDAQALASGEALIASTQTAPTVGKPTRSVFLILAYSAGRIFSYACAGALVAGLGYVGAEYLALAPLLRGTAGVLLIAMGLYIAGWWRGLTVLERGGQVLWRYLQPVAQAVLPVRTTSSALVLGLLWGWLPCGLVYTALAYAATSQSPLAGMAQMAVFGLGTLPAVLAGGLSMGRYGQLLQTKQFRRLFALFLVAYGIWTLLAIFPGHRHV